MLFAHYVQWQDGLARSAHGYRALKSREISRENTGIFAHMWHQRSLLRVRGVYVIDSVCSVFVHAREYAPAIPTGFYGT